jgi:protein O-GlcNAc transferase
MSRKLPLFFLLVLCPPAMQGQDQAAARAHHDQAMALYRTHNREGAIHELVRAVEIDASYAEAWNDLGVIQRQVGDLNAAIASFQKAIGANAHFPSATYNLALALEASGDASGAMEQVRHVIDLAPKLPQ